jgi:hypothetical protein
VTPDRGSRRARLLSGAIVVASLGGAIAAWLPWHSLGYGLVEVTGLERLEGKVLVVALLLAAGMASIDVLAGTPRSGRALVTATGVASGAAALYVYVMARPESALHELVRKGLDGTFCYGILVASLAALSAFLLAVTSFRGSLRSAHPSQAEP